MRVLPAAGVELFANSLVQDVLNVGSLQLGCFFSTEQVGLLADCLQSFQGAFDVTDLCSQSVYGLHGTIQLFTTSHQCVHALWEQKHKVDHEKATGFI